MSFLLIRANQVQLLALRIPNMVGCLQENTEWLQPYRLTENYLLSRSKVVVGFKMSPIFLIVSFCFFTILTEDVIDKHGFLFSGKLTLIVLQQFWWTPFTLIHNNRKWLPLLLTAVRLLCYLKYNWFLALNLYGCRSVNTYLAPIDCRDCELTWHSHCGTMDIIIL